VVHIPFFKRKGRACSLNFRCEGGKRKGKMKDALEEELMANNSPGLLLSLGKGG